AHGIGSTGTFVSNRRTTARSASSCAPDTCVRGDGSNHPPRSRGHHPTPGPSAAPSASGVECGRHPRSRRVRAASANDNHGPCSMSSMTGRPIASPIPGLSKKWAVLIAVCILAFNLRGSMIAVAPVLETIQRELGLSGTAAGMLTTLPVLCFGAISPLAPLLARRFGLDATLLLAVTAIATGSIVRMGQPVALLYLGTFTIGAGIALLNVLIPAFVKREAPSRVGMMTSLYTMLLNAGAATGSALTVPVMNATGWSWRPALGIWTIPAVVAIGAMLPWVAHQRRNGTATPGFARRRGLWNSAVAWQLTIAMGTQSM